MWAIAGPDWWIATLATLVGLSLRRVAADSCIDQGTRRLAPRSCVRLPYAVGYHVIRELVGLRLVLGLAAMLQNLSWDLGHYTSRGFDRDAAL